MAQINPVSAVDGVLVQWGDRLFYPGNRIVKVAPPPRLTASVAHKAAGIRRRIEAIVVGRAQQAIVRVTGGGRGMHAIRLHFRYISKDGALEFEDDRGVNHAGKDALNDLSDQWRNGGVLIPETSHRREACNLTLSIQKATDAQIVLRAARAFAKIELNDHRYLMVLHQHQANPHVHLCVRLESKTGARLETFPNLQRWRETFAEQLRECGVEAEATRQATRGEGAVSVELWEIKARQQGRLGSAHPVKKSGDGYERNRLGVLEAWAHISIALRSSDHADDRELARHVGSFIYESSFVKEHGGQHRNEVTTLATERGRSERSIEAPISRGRRDPEIER